MNKRILLSVTCCLMAISAISQSHISVEGGYCQSIFYCSQAKSNYYYSFSQYNAYYVSINYKEDAFQLSKNMRLGGQIIWKRQSPWIYREDAINDSTTLATGARYDISSINISFFPELVVGEKARFYFSFGPNFQFVCNTKAKGQQVLVKNGVNDNPTPVENKNSEDIKGFTFGGKVNLGLEIPIKNNFYIFLNNSYSAGFTSFNGQLKKRMKFFNCIDIYLGGGIAYKINHKTK